MFYTPCSPPGMRVDLAKARTSSAQFCSSRTKYDNVRTAAVLVVLFIFMRGSRVIAVSHYCVLTTIPLADYGMRVLGLLIPTPSFGYSEAQVGGERGGLKPTLQFSR